MKLRMSACIEVPKEKVWQILSDVSNVNLWVDTIQSAYCEDGKTSGVGTVRVCLLKGNMNIKEKWIEWDEGHSYTYQTANVMLIKYATNKWSVETENGKSLLITESEIIFKGGFFGRILEPLMYFLFKRMGAQSLAAFKYLVEVGRPYEGTYSHLPRVPMIC